MPCRRTGYAKLIPESPAYFTLIQKQKPIRPFYMPALSNQSQTNHQQLRMSVYMEGDGTNMVDKTHHAAFRMCVQTGQSWLQSLAFRPHPASSTMHPPLLLLVLFASTVFRIAEACSSRSTPKPRSPSPTMRPNITFQTYDCPEAYAKWYCLNGATCFSVRIGESILYNCECADGFMGQRCEFKDLDGSYLPSRERVMIETASIAGGVTVAVLLIVMLSIAAYTYLRRSKKLESMSTTISPEDLARKPFNTRTVLHDHSRQTPSRDPESGRGSSFQVMPSSLNIYTKTTTTTPSP